MADDLLRTIDALRADFFGTLGALDRSQLEAVLRYAGERYYHHGESTLADDDYDRLREHYGETYGASAPIVLAPHTTVATVGKAKVALPYYLASMDKIKPDSRHLDGWRETFAGNVCVSDKLDGVSGLVVKAQGATRRSLYTRGDGTVGQDISHMLPLIQIGDLPDLAEYAVRGELIVSKARYAAIQDGKRGARQMVSGATSQRTLTAARRAEMAQIEFVAYEVIVPSGLAPSEQLRFLERLSSFAVVAWSVEPDASIDRLGAILTARKRASAYELDGIVVHHDAFHPRVAGRNPPHAFAFKMAFADQTAVTRVVEVRWDASKDGLLKPTVQFEPVSIGGVTIQAATGFHAAFVHAHCLGPGAFIEVIRSGDVIPHIAAVKSPAPDGASMPAAGWHWNDTRVDAVLDDAANHADVRKKALLFFATALQIDHCGEGTVARLHDAGIDTIPRLVGVTAAQLVERVQGFQATSAAKLVAAIAGATAKATRTQWAVGSGVFGRGIGAKRLEAALTVVPDSLEADAGLADRIVALGGWSRATADAFVEALPAFRRFMDAVGVAPRPASVATPAPRVDAAGEGAGPLAGYTVLFTGFHPKDLEKAVVARGAQLLDGWRAGVTHLIVKDATIANAKTKNAEATGVAILTAAQLREVMGMRPMGS